MLSPWTASDTRMALAFVCFTLGAYFGLARKVRCPGPACSMPATPEISNSPSPSRRHSRLSAIFCSFIRPIGRLSQRTARRCCQLQICPGTSRAWNLAVLPGEVGLGLIKSMKSLGVRIVVFRHWRESGECCQSPGSRPRLPRHTPESGCPFRPARFSTFGLERPRCWCDRGGLRLPKLGPDPDPVLKRWLNPKCQLTDPYRPTFQTPQCYR